MFGRTTQPTARPAAPVMNAEQTIINTVCAAAAKANAAFKAATTAGSTEEQRKDSDLAQDTLVDHISQSKELLETRTQMFLVTKLGDRIISDAARPEQERVFERGALKALEKALPPAPPKGATGTVSVDLFAALRREAPRRFYIVGALLPLARKIGFNWSSGDPLRSVAVKLCRRTKTLMEAAEKRGDSVEYGELRDGGEQLFDKLPQTWKEEAEKVYEVTSAPKGHSAFDALDEAGRTAVLSAETTAVEAKVAEASTPRKGKEKKG